MGVKKQQHKQRNRSAEMRSEIVAKVPPATQPSNLTIGEVLHQAVLANA